MAEEKPAPLQPALWKAESTGDPGDGSTQPGQHLLNQHWDTASSLCPLLTAWHAKGKGIYINMRGCFDKCCSYLSPYLFYENMSCRSCTILYFNLKLKPIRDFLHKLFTILYSLTNVLEYCILCIMTKKNVFCVKLVLFTACVSVKQNLLIIHVVWLFITTTCWTHCSPDCGPIGARTSLSYGGGGGWIQCASDSHHTWSGLALLFHQLPFRSQPTASQA